MMLHTLRVHTAHIAVDAEELIPVDTHRRQLSKTSKGKAGETHQSSTLSVVGATGV